MNEAKREPSESACWLLPNLPDGDSAAEPPVPIPNTEVKCRHVDGSAVLSRVRVDNCQAPIRSSSSAWLERLPVTQEVTGSIPVCSAIHQAPGHMLRGFSFLNSPIQKKVHSQQRALCVRMLHCLSLIAAGQCRKAPRVSLKFLPGLRCASSC